MILCNSNVLLINEINVMKILILILMCNIINEEIMILILIMYY